MPKVQKRAINVNSDVWKGIDVDEIDEDDDHVDPVLSTSTTEEGTEVFVRMNRISTYLTR